MTKISFLLAVQGPPQRQAMTQLLRAGIEVREYGPGVLDPGMSPRPGIYLCMDASELNAYRDSGSLAVWLSTLTLTVESMLDALSLGAVDCWSLEMSDEELAGRAASVLTRWGAILDEAGPAQSMRAELERDQQAGRQIQLGMLPKHDKKLGAYRFRRWMTPSLILSGDFIDYFPLQRRHLACFLADVAGHGASSALLTVMLKNISWRMQQKFGEPNMDTPGALLAWINQSLLEQGIEKHVAMFLGIIDKFDHTLHYSMAAQYPPALLVQEDGKVQSLGLVGKPLGLFADAEYVSATVEFSLGSTLCVFSDGVLDCLEPSDLVEKEQSLADKLAKTEALSALWKELEAANPGRDDMCLMAVKRQR